MSIFRNIHKLASLIIPRQTIEWHKYKGVTVDQYGQAKPTYETAAVFKAHVQPGMSMAFGSKGMEQQHYADLGLDWTHNYVSIWVSDADINSVSGDNMASDRIKVCATNRFYNIVKVSDFYVFDGWKCVICEEVQK